MKHLLRALGLLVAASAWSTPTQAEVDVEGVLLMGTGVDTGNAPNNPYLAQFGGAVEITVAGWVAGVRATRSIGDKLECDVAVGYSCAPNVNDLRTIGVDLGMDWELGIVHLSPRVGLGYLNEKRGDLAGSYAERGGIAGAYIEPGGVAELELGWFVLGADLRYRVAIKEREADGFLAYGRVGFRF